MKFIIFSYLNDRASTSDFDYIIVNNNNNAEI